MSYKAISQLNRKSRIKVSFSLRKTVYECEAGFSLFELLIALSTLAIIGTILSMLLVCTLKSQNFSSTQDEMMQMARLAMERMVANTMQANRILLPLENNPTRTILALGGYIDNDGDGRYDEDLPHDVTMDNAAGIAGLDDDNDASIDEGSGNDDDEDGTSNEDPVNNLDDDGDGAIDEDPSRDMNGDGVAGLARVDDNADGLVDNASPNDDDEDGAIDEDPIEALVYYLDPATRTLWERYPVDGAASVTTALAEEVETFQVQRLVGANGVTLIAILLRLQDSDGHITELQTRVRPRNMPEP